MKVVKPRLDRGAGEPADRSSRKSRLPQRSTSRATRASTTASTRRDEPFCLEANPNPEIARYEEMAKSAEMAGMSYEALLQRILNLGLRR